MTAYPVAPEYTDVPRPFPAGFKDRKIALIVFGILWCVAGGFLAIGAILAPLAVMLVQVLPQQAGVPQTDLRSVAVMAVAYAGLGALFLWLGVDSFRAKRWVRPIALTVAWTWLLVGLTALIGFLYAADEMVDLMTAQQQAQGAPPLPREFRVAMVVMIGAFSAVIYAVVPAAFVWFYNSRHVRATLEHYDPNPSWTDRAPTPVLGLSVGLALAAASMLLLLPYGILPAFGALLTGPAAYGGVVGCAALLALCAWTTFRRQMVGWWLTLVASIGIPVAMGMTFHRLGVAEVYRRAGFPDDTVKMMEAYGGSGAATMISAIVLGIACVAYMVYVRKYFRADAPHAGPLRGDTPHAGSGA